MVAAEAAGVGERAGGGAAAALGGRLGEERVAAAAETGLIDAEPEVKVVDSDGVQVWKRAGGGAAAQLGEEATQVEAVAAEAAEAGLVDAGPGPERVAAGMLEAEEGA